MPLCDSGWKWANPCAFAWPILLRCTSKDPCKCMQMTSTQRGEQEKTSGQTKGKTIQGHTKVHLVQSMSKATQEAQEANSRRSNSDGLQPTCDGPRCLKRSWTKTSGLTPERQVPFSAPLFDYGATHLHTEYSREYSKENKKNTQASQTLHRDP